MAARLLIALAAVGLVGVPIYADDFRIQISRFEGDPKANPEGTLQGCIKFGANSGTKEDVRLGGQQTTNGIDVPFRNVICVTATNSGHGAVRVEVEFEHSESVGPTDKPKWQTARNKTARTIQLGERIRLSLGDDPKYQRWVEVIVRKEK
jgi:hypothetical protein